MRWGPNMDLRKLKKLIDLVEASGIAELEITEGEEKVRISRTGSLQAPVNAVVAPAVSQAAPAPAMPASAEPEATQVPGHGLKSPMVGTFYRAPTPGAKPFVAV